MGVTGHIGVAFDPADEAVAIAAVNGAHDGDEWLRHNTEFGLIRENCTQLHDVLGKLVTTDPSLAPLTTAVFGTRAVGEGPTHPMCLYTAEEVQQIADSFARVGDAALEQAIAELRHEAGADAFWFPNDLHEAFRRVGGEYAHVAENRWSLIAFMF